MLGGTYLASYVETHNATAPVAQLRREWFITYASIDKHVVPAATACADQLTDAQLANYTQVGRVHCNPGTACHGAQQQGGCAWVLSLGSSTAAQVALAAAAQAVLRDCRHGLLMTNHQ